MARDLMPLHWSEMTWKERVQTVIGTILAGIVGLAMLFGVLLVLGQIIDTQDKYRSEYRRCLQDATNGLEIARCRGERP